LPPSLHARPRPPLIDQFLDALWLEKACPTTPACLPQRPGLFNGWLQEHVALPDAGRELILDHLAWRLDQGYKPRSTARFLSGVRGFSATCCGKS
jgi:integrase/recombinase XerD